MKDYYKCLIFLLLSNCSFLEVSIVVVADTCEEPEFEVIHKWQFLNYTWPSLEIYKDAVDNQRYIPENNDPTGLKIYGEKIYISIPRMRPGIPATLAYVPMVDQGMKSNQLLTPYPNWALNVEGDCKALQSVQSMEINKQGQMWVIDGARQTEDAKCPAKLIILDLKKKGQVIHKYIFPEEIVLSKGGHLNDIVLDDVEGGYAYITDSSLIDPGLVVYSLKKDKSWKLRDPSVFPEPEAANFMVDGFLYKKLIPIDGIALSPSNNRRQVFFSSLTGLNLYSIYTSNLKNESFEETGQWRRKVMLVGKKQAQTDGMMIDSEGNLYYTLIPANGIGKWNIQTPFDTAEVYYEDDKKMIWPSTFAMDGKGFLYVISNKVYEFSDPNTQPKISCHFKFRIFKHFTGTKSYMYQNQ